MLCFILTGCSLNNTPKAKVETLLMKYQKNSDSVMSELDDYLNKQWDIIDQYIK